MLLAAGARWGPCLHTGGGGGCVCGFSIAVEGSGVLPGPLCSLRAPVSTEKTTREGRMTRGVSVPD